MSLLSAAALQVVLLEAFSPLTRVHKLFESAEAAPPPLARSNYKHGCLDPLHQAQYLNRLFIRPQSLRASQIIPRMSRYESSALLPPGRLEYNWEPRFIAARKSVRGLPGLSRSRTARAQQVAWTASRRAMQMRNEDSFGML